jgi:type I restriction enzyme S subunit
MNRVWETKKLGEVLTIERGGSPRPIEKFLTSSEDGYNWIKISDATASDKYIYTTKDKISADGLHKTRIVSPGDFLLSNSMSFGRPYIMKTTGCIHDGWLVLKENGKKVFDPEFLYYLLSAPNVYEQFNSLAAGSTVRNLNIALVSSVCVPIPTLPEQKRIVAILDEAFSGIARAKEIAEKNLANAREIFESFLNNIFSSPLNGWIELELSEICEVKDGTHDSPQYHKEGIPFATQKNIRPDGFSLDSAKFISKQDHENYYRRSNVAFGDILISMIGANRGMACIVDTRTVFSIKNVCLVKRSDKVNQKYLLHYLNSQRAKSFVQSSSKGGAQEFIGLTELRRFPIVYAPLNQQNGIVSRLDELYTESKRIESVYDKKLASLEELKKSLLHQAFSGALFGGAAS